MVSRQRVPLAVLLTFGVVALAFIAADPLALKVQGPDTLGTPLQTTAVGTGATGSQVTAISSSATGAAAIQTATLAASAGKFTYISGAAFCSGGATAGSVITCTVAGTAGGTLNFSFAVPTGVAVATSPIVVQFSPPLQSSAVNTAIVVTIPSAGAGNTGESVAAWGFQQ